jgi:hypothetical protein
MICIKTYSRTAPGAAAVLLFAACLLASSIDASGAEARQRSFATPEEAVKNLFEAVRANSPRTILSVLGPDAKTIVYSGDPIADKADRERFVKAYEEANDLTRPEEGMALLTIGKDGWVFPIPIAKEASGWRFDTREGKEEIFNRRIGRNELSAIRAAEAYGDAQREYYLRNPQNDKLLQYAQKFVSSKGKRDGLYFPVNPGEQESPLGPLFDKLQASRKGKTAKRVPYHGYYYKILKGQGPDAPGGAYSYLAGDRMIGGFALVAWPASYGNSGIMTFLINHDGIVYEKDLGRDTSAVAEKMTQFNPDKSWKASSSTADGG